MGKCRCDKQLFYIRQISNGTTLSVVRESSASPPITGNFSVTYQNKTLGGKFIVYRHIILVYWFVLLVNVLELVDIFYPHRHSFDGGGEQTGVPVTVSHPRDRQPVHLQAWKLLSIRPTRRVPLQCWGPGNLTGII